MKTNGAPKLAIFDLGNVCIEIAEARCYEVWERLAGMPKGSLKPRSIEEPWFFAYERGEIDDRDFWRRLRRNWGLPLDFEAWERGWNALFGQEIAPTRRAAERLRQAGAQVVALSNTNARHVACMKSRYGDLLETFDATRFSNEIGMRKPESRVFDWTLRESGCAPCETVFFDDRRDNVDAARALGIEAIRFDHPETALRWTEERLGGV